MPFGVPFSILYFISIKPKINIMKKQSIKNLAFKKSIVSSFITVENVKGGRNPSQTSCWCKMSECDCIAEDTMS